MLVFFHQHQLARREKQLYIKRYISSIPPKIIPENILDLMEGGEMSDWPTLWANLGIWVA